MTTPNENVAVARVTLRGKLDGTFGNGGIVVSDFNVGGADYAEDAALLNDGSIVVAGAVRLNSTTTEFLVAKYSADGSLEASTQTSFPGFTSASAAGISVLPSGKLLVVGSALIPTGFVPFRSRFAMARYTKM